MDENATAEAGTGAVVLGRYGVLSVSSAPSGSESGTFSVPAQQGPVDECMPARLE